MAITFVGAGTVVSGDATGATGIELTPHASTLTDDLMIVFQHRNDDQFAFPDPVATGWTNFAAETWVDGEDMQTVIGYKIATSDSEAAVTFLHGDNTSEQWSGVILTFRGVDTTNPIDVAYVKATHYQELLDKASPNVDAFKQITTVTDGAVVLAIEAVTFDDITSDADPSGYTVCVRATGTSPSHYNRQFQIWYKTVATFGPETPGAAAYTSSLTTGDSQQYTMAIRPAASGVSIPIMMNHYRQMRD